MSLKLQGCGEITNPPALATGVVQVPMTPVEYGRTAEGLSTPDDTSDDLARGGSGELTPSCWSTTTNNGDTDMQLPCWHYVNTLRYLLRTVADVAVLLLSCSYYRHHLHHTYTMTCTYTGAGATPHLCLIFDRCFIRRN